MRPTAPSFVLALSGLLLASAVTACGAAPEDGTAASSSASAVTEGEGKDAFATPIHDDDSPDVTVRFSRAVTLYGVDETESASTFYIDGKTDDAGPLLVRQVACTVRGAPGARTIPVGETIRVKLLRRRIDTVDGETTTMVHLIFDANEGGVRTVECSRSIRRNQQALTISLQDVQDAFWRERSGAALVLTASGVQASPTF
ncbi:MAG: hypothetical protein U0169_04520 [Polyangiaceae bacterium]